MNRKLRKRGEFTVVAFGMLAGLLLWSKLKLVSDVPRTAYAEPDSEVTEVTPRDSTQSKEADSPSTSPEQGERNSQIR